MSFRLTELGKRELILAYIIPISFFILTGLGSFLSLKKLSSFLYIQAKSYINLEYIHSIDIKSKELSQESLNQIFLSLDKLKVNNQSHGKDRMIASLRSTFRKIESSLNGKDGLNRKISSLPNTKMIDYQIKQLKINERKEIELNIRHFSNAIFITRKVILFGLSFTLLTSFSFLIFFIYSQN
ncbi:MAG: hypothetical protein VXW15_12465 [Bdellovibrionota bacterium]|nr:hypothetical protein [Bdellovibrionota bacterium]